jgi:3-oxoacid CoA-transferase subunit B
MAVIDVTPGGMALREIAAGLTVDEVIAATAVPLLIDENELSAF